MLNAVTLEQNLKDMFHNTIPGAFEQCFLELYTDTSDEYKEKAKQFGKTFDELVTPSWSKTLAQAIDYYIKNAQISGTIITAGSPFSQTAVIMSTPTPTINGKVPNTLGIM